MKQNKNKGTDRFSILQSDQLAELMSLSDPSFNHKHLEIKNFEDLKLIGEGGFGLVYQAQQTHPIRRQVAIKVIKPGMDSKAVLARFEVERQALAMMEHPNIANVLDAGVTEIGHPYFVMELVKGVPITEYCDKNNLDIRERLQLFIDVCKAVQHAHHKGIIHRDIKPSNVLIILQDNMPVPKVIDFGIAKAIDQRLTKMTLFTDFKQFIGTPVYMSPEQASMGGLDVDMRSDIYSLGVLLYELITGATPFCAQILRDAGYDEMRRIIREEEPPKPSIRLSSLGETLADIAKNRRTKPDSLTKLIRGELDWIVMKLLEKDRTRRYETTNEVALEIQRYLSDEPVIAGPPSRVYRLRKLVIRHRYTSTVVTLMLFIVLCFCYISFELYFTSVKNLKQLEASREQWSAESTRNYQYLRQRTFIRFLQRWHQDRNKAAIEVYPYLSEGYKEQKAANFLLDSRPLYEKESDFRQEFSAQNGWFADFVIAELHHKEDNSKEAVKLFQKSYSTLKQLLNDNQDIDHWALSQIQARLELLNFVEKARETTVKEN